MTTKRPSIKDVCLAVDTALEFGNLVSAVDAVLAASDSDELPLLLEQLDRIGQAAALCRGVLDPAGPRKVRIAELYREAEAEPSHLVEHLWRSLEHEHGFGVAAFPLAPIGAFPCGTIRELRVTQEDMPPVGDPLDIVRDATFRDAVLEAIRLAAFYLGRPEGAPLRVEILPRAPANATLEDGSAAAAAFIAAASFIGRRPAPARFAWSGCLGAAEFTSIGVATLSPKLEALDQRRQLGGLRCHMEGPPGFERTLPRRVTLLPSDPWAVLTSAFGVALDPRRPLSSQAPSRQSGVDVRSQEHEELRLRLAAVVLALNGPTPIETIEDAVGRMQPRVGATGFSVGRELRSWLDGHKPGRPAVSIDAAGVVDRKGPERELLDVAGRRLLEAHRALGRQSELRGRPGLVEAAHHWLLAGEPSELDATIQQLAEAADAQCLEDMERLHRLMGEHVGPERAADLLSAALRSGTIRCRFMELALECRSLPAPLCELAPSLARGVTAADRLLAAQAVVEVCLVLIASVALSALRRSGAESFALASAEMAVRPSIGGIVRAIRSAFAALPAEQPEAVRLLSEQVRGPLAERLLDQGIPNRANRCLHGLGAWSRLLAVGDPAGGSAEAEYAEADRGALALLDDATALTASIAPTVTQFPFVVGPLSSAAIDLGDGDRLDLTGLVRPLRRSDGRATWAFYRGAINGIVRYWGFDEPLDVRLHAPRDVPLPDLLGHDATWSATHPRVWVAHFLPDSVDTALYPIEARERVKMHPTPLARIVGSKLPSAAQRLAMLDLAFSTWLRLITLPAIWGSYRKRGADPIADGDGPLSGRVTKWRLLETLSDLLACEADRGPEVALLASWLEHERADERLRELVDALQRFEHLPGPLGAYEAELDKAEGRFGWLLERSPWTTSDGVMLVGRDPGGVVFAFRGERPWAVVEGRGATWWERASSGLAPGELAWITSESVIVPFGDTAEVAAGAPARCVLFNERRGKTRCYFEVSDRAERPFIGSEKAAPGSGRGARRSKETTVAT